MLKREKNETGSEEDVKSQMRVENDVLYRRMGVGNGSGRREGNEGKYLQYTDTRSC